jgi:hypothetical protein
MINPQIKKMHDGAKKGVSAALPKDISAHGGAEDTQNRGEHGHENHVEVHAHPGGGAHTVHHPSGERKEHASMADAHKAVDDHFAENGLAEQNPGGDMEASAMGQSSEY